MKKRNLIKKKKLWSIIGAILFCILVFGWLYYDNYINCPSWAETLKAALIIKATQAQNEVLVTYDLNTYMMRMQEINQALAYLPKQCIPKTVSQHEPDKPCPQLWSTFDECEHQWKMKTAAGQFFLYTCVKPKCPR